MNLEKSKNTLARALACQLIRFMSIVFNQIYYILMPSCDDKYSLYTDFNFKIKKM